MRVVAVLVLLLAGCTHVKPHQRELLSRPSMTPSTDAYNASFEAHLRESREGSSASASAGGGGCGCN